MRYFPLLLLVFISACQATPPPVVDAPAKLAVIAPPKPLPEVAPKAALVAVPAPAKPQPALKPAPASEPVAIHAAVKLPSVFSDHMVLQQGRKVPVWGWAAPGESITVKFAGQEKRIVANANGMWKVSLDPLKASAEPQILTVTGNNTLEVKDVLVGEVWICSGQSNMQWTVQRAANAKEEIAAADFPGIRMLTVARKTNPDRPLQDAEGAWKVTTPETAGGFSAVGYYFGRYLHQQLDVPIGLINSSWGGTRSEAWTSLAALQSEPAALPILETWMEKRTNYTPEKAKADLEARVLEWQEKVNQLKAAALEKGTKPKLPRKPGLATDPAASQHHYATLYNAMLAPLVPYAIRGTIWYQGESNASRAKQYETIFPLMIKDWRTQWNQGAFPFYFVQLANFKKVSTEPGAADPWAELQWAQFRTLQLEHTGMAVINDIGEAGNIHPKNKQDVGRRLALWALHKNYGKDLVYSGPLFKGHRIGQGAITVTFDQADGLKSRDGGPLKRFEIAGADRQWHWADAKIDGETVVVSSPAVAEPVAVRYAWASNPEGANLVNGAGLPASLFKTDDWEWSTAENVKP